MKQIFLLITCCVISTCIFAQGDTDSLFDDGVNEKSVVAIGSDILTSIAGTFNIHVHVTPIKKIGIQVEGGIVPFGRHFDLVNVIDTGFPIRDTLMLKAFYWSAIAQYNWHRVAGIVDRYFYLDLKRWHYQPIDGVKAIKTKFTFFGLGVRVHAGSHFSVEGNIGAIAGSVRLISTKDFNNNPQVYGHLIYDTGYEKKYSFVGFDLGLGFKYHF